MQDRLSKKIACAVSVLGTAEGTASTARETRACGMSPGESATIRLATLPLPAAAVTYQTVVTGARNEAAAGMTN